jgi:hypothetical protein
MFPDLTPAVHVAAPDPLQLTRLHDLADRLDSVADLILISRTRTQIEAASQQLDVIAMNLHSVLRELETNVRAQIKAAGRG